MNITRMNIRIDGALRAAVKAGTLSQEDCDAACALITKGETADKPPLSTCSETIRDAVNRNDPLAIGIAIGLGSLARMKADS